MSKIGQCPELGLAGVSRLMGENGCDGANESFISRSTLPYCLYRTSAIVLSGVGLGNFGFKAKHLCCFICFHISVVSVCNQSLCKVLYFACKALKGVSDTAGGGGVGSPGDMTRKQ